MMTPLNILLVLLVLGVVPFLIGTLYSMFAKTNREKAALAVTYVYGMLTMMAAFFVIALPLTLFKVSYHVALISWLAVVTVLCITAVVLAIKNHYYKIVWEENVQALRRINIVLVIAAAFILFQASVLTGMQHIDEDDAFYVATAATTLETNTMYQISSDTGKEYHNMPARYFLSAFPIYTAAISDVTQLHPTILAHTVFPMVFIVFMYLVFGIFAKKLFQGDLQKTGIFLIVLSTIYCFSYTSAFPAAVFALVRMWQGKAILAGALLPGAFYISYKAMQEEGSWKDWMMLLIINMCACLVSSMGIALMPILTGCIGLTYSVIQRKLRIIIKTILCCIPEILCGLIYIAYTMI